MNNSIEWEKEKASMNRIYQPHIDENMPQKVEQSTLSSYTGMWTEEQKIISPIVKPKRIYEEPSFHYDPRLFQKGLSGFSKLINSIARKDL